MADTAAEAGSAAAAEGGAEVAVKIKWSGKLFPVSLPPTAPVLELKRRLQEQTGVEPRRQRILGLKTGARPATDEDAMSSLALPKGGGTFVMMGSTEERLSEVLAKPAEPVVFEEDLEDDDDATEMEEASHPDNVSRLAKLIEGVNIEVRTAPRPGKKLLVLDIDYTLYDHRSTAERMEELTRPFLHEFLTAAYQHFDIAIWSATSMKWVQAKIAEMGMNVNPNYRLTFVLDHTYMVRVRTKAGEYKRVKPLQVIWAKVYHPRNTIMFDDVRRNFAMNKANGLTIKPCRHLPIKREEDRELRRLARYLERIGRLSEDEFAALNHDLWKDKI